MIGKMKFPALIGVVAGSLAVGVPSVSAETTIPVGTGTWNTACLGWNGNYVQLDWDPADFESLSYSTTDSQLTVSFTTTGSADSTNLYFNSFARDLAGCTSGPGDPHVVACLNVTNLAKNVPVTNYFEDGTHLPGGGGAGGETIPSPKQRFIISRSLNGVIYFPFLFSLNPAPRFTGFYRLTLLEDADYVSELAEWSIKDLCKVANTEHCYRPFGDLCEYHEYLRQRGEGLIQVGEDLVQRVEESGGLPDTL